MRTDGWRSLVRVLACSAMGAVGCVGSEFTAESTDDETGSGGEGGAGGAAGALQDPDAALTTTPDSSMPGAVDARTDTATHPPEIPTSGLALWLSGDVGVQISGGGLVTGWSDRSGNARNAIQVVPSNQPLVMPGWHGGKPAIHFDGTMRFLVLPAGFASFSTGLSLFVVADVTEDANCPSFLSLSNGGENEDVSLHRQPGAAFEYEVADSSFSSPNNEQPLKKPTLMTVVHHPDARAGLYVGGAFLGEKAMALPASVSRGKNEIGRSSYQGCENLNGNIAEIVLYTRAVEESERSKVEAYLSSKWAL